MYNRDDYIEEVPVSNRHFGKYKYRVMDRQNVSATHHTNCIEDAKWWADRCIKYWLEQDELAI